MGALLGRVAFSPNIRDRLDYSCALFNRHGQLLGQATHIPVHLGSMAYAMGDLVGSRDWQAGDIAVVHNNCVHQHFNASATKPARALVLKTKPMFVFMNMLFQKQVVPRDTEPAPGGENFTAREEEENFNHPEEGY